MPEGVVLYRIIGFFIFLGMVWTADREIADIYANLVEQGQVRRSTAHRIVKADCNRQTLIFSQCTVDIQPIQPVKAQEPIRIFLTFSGTVNGKDVYPVLAGPAPGRVTVNLGFEHMTNRLLTMAAWLGLALIFLFYALFASHSDEEEADGMDDILIQRGRRWGHTGIWNSFADKLKF